MPNETSGTMIPSGNVSEHFSWAEATFTSQRDPRTGLTFANTPGPEEMRNLVHTFKMMEEVRALFGKPIMVHSAYRSPLVNFAVGGAVTSQHMRGQAVDFHVLNVDVVPAFEEIRMSSLPFDQLIEEAATWIHVSFIEGTPRRQALRMRVQDGKAKYEVVPNVAMTRP